MRVPVSLLLIGVLLLSPLAQVAHAQTTEADVYVAQAILDFDDKRYEPALDNLKKALELEPDHVEALYYTGVVHMARRRPNEAVPFLLRARQKSPRDPSVAFQLGLAYFGQQLYEQAEPLIEEVFRVNPELDGLGYYVGFLRYRKKDYRGAINAFRAGRASDPEIQQLTRFYTGLALAVLGQSAQAVAEVEQALRQAPGSALTGPAERLRDTIVATRAKERPFSAELRLGGFYDTNVPVVPHADSDANVTAIRDGQQRRASWGELVGFRIDYPWLRHFVKREDWDASVGYSFFATINNQLPQFDVTDHLVNTSVTYRSSIAGMPAQAGGQYAFDALYLHSKPFIDRHTVTLFGALAERESAGWVPGHLTQVFTRFQKKDFKDRPNIEEQDRDGNNYMVGFLHLLRFQSDAHLVKFGYQHDRDDVKGDDFRYGGHRIVAGALYTLPWQGIRLKYDFDAHIRDYKLASSSRFLAVEPNTIERRDRELVHVFRAEYPFMSTCVTKGDCLAWTLSAEYQRTNVYSNVPVFDYSRNVFSLILSITY